MSLDDKILLSCLEKQMQVCCTLHTGKMFKGYVVDFDDKVLLIAKKLSKDQSAHGSPDAVVYRSAVALFSNMAFIAE